MNRSTNTAPVSLSTSYLIGSPCIGISMMTLQSLGTSLPAGTRSRFMVNFNQGSQSGYSNSICIDSAAAAQTRGNVARLASDMSETNFTASMESLQAQPTNRLADPQAEWHRPLAGWQDALCRRDRIHVGTAHAHQPTVRVGNTMTPRNKSSFAIGSGAGFAGDRIEPAVAMAKSGQVDAIALECLAERTLINALKTRHSSAEGGYDPRLRRRLGPLLGALGGHCRVLTNLGAANPAAAARAARALAREAGAAKLRIAAVLGDDVADRISDIAWTQPTAGGEWIGAHVYLGIEPMAEALADGADVVITGRVADSSLFAAAPVHALGLSGDSLAGALTLGHLLECAGQLSGGNLSEP